MVKALYRQKAVAGLILADAIPFIEFVPFSKELKSNCLFPTHGFAEAYIVQWIDTARNLFISFPILLTPV